MSVKATFFMRIYNVEASLLRRAVESVLGQTESELRFIIQDNGSTDGSTEILKEYAKKDTRIELFRNEVNSEATYKEWQIREEVLYRNVEECGSQYFAIIDSDDYYQKNFLEKTYRIAEEKNASIVFSGYRQVGADGGELAQKIPRQMYLCGEEMTSEMYQEGYPLFRTLWGNLYSTKLWRDYWRLLDVERPGYMKNGLDTYINLQFLKNLDRFLLLDECLYTQHIHTDSVYRLDCRTERILEADALFLQGVEVAQHYKIFNEQILLFLSSVYYYYLRDIVQDAWKGEDKKRINDICNLLEKSEVYGMLAEKGKDFQDLLRILRLKGE